MGVIDKLLEVTGLGQPKLQDPKQTPSMGDAALAQKKQRARYKEADDISAEPDKDNAESGNPCHYQTHVGDKQGMNRQGRSSGVTCHHRKS